MNELKEQEIFKKMKASYYINKGRIPVSLNQMAKFLSANGWMVVLEKRTYIGAGRKKGRYFTQEPSRTKFTYLEASNGKQRIVRGYPDTTLRSVNLSILMNFGYFGK